MFGKLERGQTQRSYPKRLLEDMGVLSYKGESINGRYPYQITKVESGVVNKPSVQTMAKIAEALGVSIEDSIE